MYCCKCLKTNNFSKDFYHMNEERCNNLENFEIVGQVFEQKNMGIYKKIYKAKKASEICSLRVINMDTCTDKQLNMLKNELYILSTLNHVNIEKSMQIHSNNTFLINAISVQVFGSCRSLLMNYFNNGLPLSLVSYIIVDVINGLNYLYLKRIIHRAIRADSLLVASDGCIKLSNFAHSAQLNFDHRCSHEFSENDISNIPWLAPEILIQNINGYSVSSDMYSLGMCMVELIMGENPYISYPSIKILHEKTNGNCIKFVKQLDLNDSKHYGHLSNEIIKILSKNKTINNPKMICKLIESCLQVLPIMRPSYEFLSKCKRMKRMAKKEWIYLTTSIHNEIEIKSSSSLNKDDRFECDKMLWTE